MSPYQKSFLDQSETFVPLAVRQSHEMVVLSKNLDWDFLRGIAEEIRRGKVKSTRGQEPHYRALLGAVVVRALKSCDLREAEDLIANYLPARFLCDLHNSQWTPDHNTIWLFEVMLGEEGVQQINDYVLGVANKKGFIDSKGLCSDTTAQEGDIPYPNEVGHMNSFMKSLRSNLTTLSAKATGLKRKVIKKMSSTFAEVGSKVRSHRLFAKTPEAKGVINKELLKMTSSLMAGLGELLSEVSINKNHVYGSGKRAFGNLHQIYQNMWAMWPQIRTWIEKGQVVQGKIVSLFNTKFKAINRGKSGKKIEFGLKWGVNQIRGGYVSVFQLPEMMAHDANYAVTGVAEHIRIFGQAPRDFGFDRAGWSQPHMEEIKNLGVKNLGIAPKGKSKWRVGPRIKARMTCERAQVEGKIGTMKSYGFNKSKAKTNAGVQRSAFRAGLCFNLRRLFKDLRSAEMMAEMQRV